MQIFKSRRKPHILVACQPKSGSTFLTKMLAALPGMRLATLVPAYERREQELCEFCLRRNDRRAYAAQLHVRRSRETDRLIAAHGVTVVVLVRDLFDAAVSLRDHLRQEDVAIPMGFFSQCHASLPDDALETMIARCAIPWYVNFYMGWRTFEGALLVRYGELIQDPRGTVKRIADAAGIEASDEDVLRAVSEASETRFNVGVKGRGAALTREAMEHIVDLLLCYSEAKSDPYFSGMLQGSGALSTERRAADKTLDRRGDRKVA